jgi:hypothetical protein
MSAAFVQLFEMREPLKRYYQSLVPDWPPYVVEDFFRSACGNDWKNGEMYRDCFHLRYGDTGKWHLETVHLTFKAFTKETQRQLKERLSGKVLGIPRDAERHAAQRALLLQRGTREPILLVQEGRRYDLLEGFHRTVQALQLFPDGYDQPAYVWK